MPLLHWWDDSKHKKTNYNSEQPIPIYLLGVASSNNKYTRTKPRFSYLLSESAKHFYNLSILIVHLDIVPHTVGGEERHHSVGL